MGTVIKQEPVRERVDFKPGGLKKFLRRWVRSRYRRYLLGRSLKKFVADPEQFSKPGNAVLRDLQYAWGNKSHIAGEEYLSACLDDVFKTQGPILECGSGLSTLLIAAVAKTRGLDHWVLEHQPRWADKVRRQLIRFNLDRTTLRVSPLSDYGEYSWYQPPTPEMPADFALVVCDGPPGKTRGGRYGLVPSLRERLRKQCIILLDDAGREGEMTIAGRWSNELNAPFKVLGTTKPYIRMILPTDKP